MTIAKQGKSAQIAARLLHGILLKRDRLCDRR
jgi:hypothetical protein